MGRGILCILALLAVVAPGSAVAAGGASIASAPTVAYGVQQFGNTATGQHGEFGCYREYWQLPVLAGDKLTINWESAVPTTTLSLAAVGTTDFTYFQHEPIFFQRLTNGRNQARYMAPVTGAMPLVFGACQSEAGSPAPGPYDFTTSDQHSLAPALTPITNIYRRTTIKGRASLADGTPAPDGLVFQLVAKWHSESELHRVTAAATSAGGGLAFQLALPIETAGRTVRLSISRAEDSAYQTAKSLPVNVKVRGSQHKHHQR